MKVVLCKNLSVKTVARAAMSCEKCPSELQTVLHSSFQHKTFVLLQLQDGVSNWPMGIYHILPSNTFCSKQIGSQKIAGVIILLKIFCMPLSNFKLDLRYFVPGIVFSYNKIVLPVFKCLKIFTFIAKQLISLEFDLTYLFKTPLT